MAQPTARFLYETIIEELAKMERNSMEAMLGSLSTGVHPTPPYHAGAVETIRKIRFLVQDAYKSLIKEVMEGNAA